MHVLNVPEQPYKKEEKKREREREKGHIIINRFPSDWYTSAVVKLLYYEAGWDGTVS